MSERVPFNPDAALLTARSFRKAGLDLEAVAEQTMALVHAPGGNLTTDLVQQMTGERIVPVVLFAFALEIVLKVRLYRAGRSFGQTHNHAKLFAMLPDAEKQALAERYAAGRNPMFLSATLEQALTWSGDAFVEWRYKYEYKSCAGVSVGEMLLAFSVLQEGLCPCSTRV